jgi:hypothetical protein
VTEKEQIYFYEPQSDENWVCCVRNEELIYVPRNYIEIIEEQYKSNFEETKNNINQIKENVTEVKFSQ